ncbi:MAG: acyltransferase family protein [Burkholderiales bacterium]
MEYRREIDGLRALAVLPVIFFHAGFQVFPGGYAGVDVFFVISGYLITSVILSEKRAGDFSLLNFYERRARRLLPVLYLVMLACLPFAFFLMVPDDFENFGQSLVATSLFANNVLLYLTSDYFGLHSQFKPLVHTWSLGVEEQYYLLYPPLLLLLLTINKRFAQASLAALALMSLGVAHWGSAHAPVATFYLIHTRGWELLIGCLIALHTFGQNASERGGKNARNSVRQSLSLLGLLMIAYSVLAFDENTPTPGLHALVPTMGAALVLLFATGETLAGRLLGVKPLASIGLISYGAYLWSNPLLAFARIASLDEPSVAIYGVCIAVTFLLAGLTWRYVETPFRRKGFIGGKSILVFSAAGGLIIASVGWTIHANSGFVRFRTELDSGIKEAGRHLNAAYNEKPYAFLNRSFSQEEKSKILVLGDSFARDFINSGLENAYFSGRQISYSDSMPSCIGGEEEIGGGLRRLIAQSDYLIYGTPAVSLQCWQRDFEILKEIGARRIIVIGTKNFGWNPNAYMRLNAAERKTYRAKVLKSVWDNNEKLANALPNTIFVNLLALLADSERRVPVFTDAGRIISQDKNHLTKDGARFVGKILFGHPLLAPLK